MARQTEYGTITAFSDINLLNDTLDGGELWISEQKTQTAGECKPAVQIFYKLPVDSNFAAEEQFVFRLARGDDHASEIYEGGITPSANDQQVTTAADVDAIEDACPVEHVHRVDAADQDIEGSFVAEEPGPDWCVIIGHDSSAGALDSTGAALHYRYLTDGESA